MSRLQGGISGSVVSVQRPGSGSSRSSARTSRTDGTGNLAGRKSKRAKTAARKAARMALTIRLDSERPIPRF